MVAPLLATGGLDPSRDLLADSNACGELGDVERVYALWEEVRTQQRRQGLSQMAILTVVEALVANRHTTPAWRLANEVWSEPHMYLVGAVAIYSSLLRGYSGQKLHGEVLKVFAQMQERNVPLNTITDNRAMQSAICQERLEMLPELLAEMRSVSSSCARHRHLLHAHQQLLPVSQTRCRPRDSRMHEGKGEHGAGRIHVRHPFGRLRG